jgi:hypothetical protein
MVAAALTVLAAFVPAAPAAAAAPASVSVWVQTLDACSSTIGGVGLSLAAGGAATVRVVPNGASRSVGSGGCPAGRGDCTGSSPSGCAVFSLTPPARGTQTYTLEQLSVPGGYAACDGGSACLGEVANFTLDSGGNVLGATVTNTLPDGVVTTQPASGASFAATASDPIVLHDDALGPGVCDGDGDSDDQLAGPPTAHCDDHPDPSLAHLVIAGTSLATGQLAEGAGFQPMATAGAPAGGGHLVGSPAVIAGTALDPALEVGTFDDGNLYVRSDAVGWRQLWSAGPGFTCVDNPAAYLDHTSATLWVACEGSDHVLHYATGSLPATSLQLPTLDGWTALPGVRLTAGPALAPAGPSSTDDPTFFAVDPTGTLWTATASTPWVARAAGCQGHPAAVLGLTATTPSTVVACRSASGGLLYGVVATGGGVNLAPATPTTPHNAAGCALAGPILDGPGLASTGAGVLVVVTGAADHLPYVATIGFPGTPGAGPVAISPYQAISYQAGPRAGTCAPSSGANPATPLAYGPAAATWSGAALTVGLITPTILAEPHSSTGAVAHLVDASGNPVPGRTVTFTTSMLVTAGATQSTSPGVYATTVIPGTQAGPARVGAASSWTSGSTSMRVYHGGYVLDAFGGIHPYGGAPTLATTAYWSGWDIARGIALRPDGAGGYVLDGFGGLHPFGDAPGVASSADWPGWDIARGVALRSDGVSGYVLDGFGGLHPFGGAPDVQASAVWPGWDIARAIVLTSDAGGYVLDGFGGLHPFGVAPVVNGSAYWPGWDIARAAAARPDGAGGYVIDGFGGVHPFGGAPALQPSASWPGWDIARGVSVAAGGTGVVLDGFGGLSVLGGGAPVHGTAYWPGWAIARGVAGG